MGNKSNEVNYTKIIIWSITKDIQAHSKGYILGDKMYSTLCHA